MKQRVNYQENQWAIDVPSAIKTLLSTTFGELNL